MQAKFVMRCCLRTCSWYVNLQLMRQLAVDASINLQLMRHSILGLVHNMMLALQATSRASWASWKSLFFTSQIASLVLNFSTIWLVGRWLTLATLHWNRRVYSSITPTLTMLRCMVRASYCEPGISFRFVCLNFSYYTLLLLLQTGAGSI